tara:strand:+ start:38 stop:1804 length:1767 start_codon:yes stop_codon:yes gene_type:complete
MSSNYSTFNYDNDFTPTQLIFNTNTTNKRYVGIGTTIPKSFLQLKGNISTTNLHIQDNFFYNITNSVNTNYISALQIDANETMILPNLVSSTFESTGIEWSIANNNNIKLTLRDNSDNTRLDYSSPYYITNTNSFNINILPITTLTLRHIYILKSDNTILNNVEISGLSQTNIILETNGIQSTLLPLLTPDKPFFKLSNFITLQANTSYTITIKNLNGYKIQLSGVYDYYSGSRWNQVDSTTYSMNSIGIGTTVPEKNLHVVGNTHITGNVNIGNLLTTPSLISNHLILEGTNNMNGIEPNNSSIIINSDKKSVGIGTTILNTDEMFSVGSHFKIKKTGFITMNNLNITNNINFNSNVSFINPNYSIYLNKSTINYQYNNKSLLNNNSDNINILTNLNIIQPDKTYTNNNNNKLFVDGNVTISGNLTVNNMDTFLYNTYNTNNLQTHTIVVNNLLDSDTFIFTDNLDTVNLIVENTLNLPKKTSDSFTTTKPQIYYNTLTKKYMIHDTKNTYRIINSTESINKDEVSKMKVSGSSVVSYIKADTINSETLDINNDLDFNSESSLYFNANSMREEVIIDNIQKCFDIMY